MIDSVLPSSLEDLQEILNKEKASAIYFSSNGCGVCEALKPKIQDLIFSEFPNIKFIEIKSEIHPEINGHFGVFSAPTFLVFLEGKEYVRKVRNMSVRELYQEISRNYNLLFY